MQKLMLIPLDWGDRNQEKEVQNHLDDGWKVIQMTPAMSAGTRGWLAVLLEKSGS